MPALEPSSLRMVNQVADHSMLVLGDVVAETTSELDALGRFWWEGPSVTWAASSGDITTEEADATATIRCRGMSLGSRQIWVGSICYGVLSDVGRGPRWPIAA